MKLLTYSALHEKDNGFWIPVRDTGLLFQIKPNNDVRLIGEFCGGGKFRDSDITKIIPTDEYLYFFSRNAFELWRLDRNDSTLTHIKYFDADIDCIVFAVKEEDNVWILPNRFDGADNYIIRLNLKTYEAKKISLGDTDKMPVSVPLYKNGKIYFAVRKPNDIRIICLDCISYIINSFSVDDAKYINCFDIDDNELYILYRTKEFKTVIGVFSLSGQPKKSYDLSGYIQYEDSIINTVFRVVKNGRKLFLVHTFCDRVDVVTTSGSESLCVDSIIGGIKPDGNIMHNDIQVCGSGFYLYSPWHGAIEWFDMNEHSLTVFDTETNDNAIPAERLRSIFSSGERIAESGALSLNHFIESIKNS